MIKTFLAGTHHYAKLFRDWKKTGSFLDNLDDHPLRQLILSSKYNQLYVTVFARVAKDYNNDLWVNLDMELFGLKGYSL